MTTLPRGPLHRHPWSLRGLGRDLPGVSVHGDDGSL